MGAVIVLVVLVVWFGWLFGTPQGRKALADRRGRALAKKPRRLSDVAERTDAGLVCPVCGGTEYDVRRKTATKVAFGPASLLGQSKHVRCVTCGTEYLRG